jgi:hypothetical protein
MRFLAAFVLTISSIFTLTLSQAVPFTAYNCTTDGIPSVAIIAGQGSNLPSVNFFLPMFENCSVADNRDPASFKPGMMNV